jgi:Rieske Fe-S protein
MPENMQSRRDFLKICGQGLVGVTIVGFMAPIINSCASPTGPGSQVASFNMTVDVSGLTSNNQALRTQTPDGYPLFIVRQSPTSYTTDLLICPHAGCSGSSFVQSPQTSLVCTCHGSVFSLTGQVTQGPAQTNLTTYSTTFNSTAKTVTIHN